MNFKKLIIYLFLVLFCTSLVMPITTCFATADDVNVNAPVALLMDSATGKIVYEKDAYKRMYPASTTKIMTAILALENCDLNDVAKVSYNAIFTVPVGYSNANLQLDEELTIEQLLYVLLIPSANDAANVIAEHIAGSIESFATMMNTKANEIGCKDTHFVNANGVHDENHYSTAYDLALIGKYAMKNEMFRKIVATTRYTLPITNKYDKADRIFVTTNKLVNSKSGQYYEYATGIKTGYTDAAKNCIVASAKKDGLEFIAVVMNTTNDASIDTNKFSDCKVLFDYGFNNYVSKLLCAKDSVYKVVKLRNASRENNSLNILYEDNVDVFIGKSDINKDFYPEVELNNKIKAPIVKGTVVGKISYTVDDIKYTTNLIAGQDVDSNSIFTIIFKIVLIIFVLWAFIKIYDFINGNKKRIRKRKNKSGRRRKSNYVSPYKFRY